MFLGFLTFRHWKATLVSTLLAKKVVLPFDDIESLMLTSDYKIVVPPYAAQMDAFKYSRIPSWQKAWNERIEPNLDFYDDYMQSKSNFNRNLKS